jgi:hypothetical protein
MAFGAVASRRRTVRKPLDLSRHAGRRAVGAHLQGPKTAESPRASLAREVHAGAGAAVRVRYAVRARERLASTQRSSVFGNGTQAGATLIIDGIGRLTEPAAGAMTAHAVVLSAIAVGHAACIDGARGAIAPSRVAEEAALVVAAIGVRDAERAVAGCGGVGRRAVAASGRAASVAAVGTLRARAAGPVAAGPVLARHAVAAIRVRDAEASRR